MNNSVRQFPLEALFWTVGLIVLAIGSPENTWTICPLHHFGFDFCPGCGLGRSITLLFHGKWSASWQTHPLGSVALIILSYRIIQLFNTYLTTTSNIQTHGPSN